LIVYWQSVAKRRTGGLVVYELAELNEKFLTVEGREWMLQLEV
jgi:hypothetical protein